MTVFELVAKLTLDSSEYESELAKQSESGGKLAGAWGKIGTAVKIGAAAIGAASAAVGALTKKSVDAYAEFEQLKGGVEKLVSHILYAGRVIHAPYVQTIGRGAKSKFWTLQNGKWKKMSTSLLKMKIRENVDKSEAASFFGK